MRRLNARHMVYVLVSTMLISCAPPAPTPTLSRTDATATQHAINVATMNAVVTQQASRPTRTPSTLSGTPSTPETTPEAETIPLISPPLDAPYLQDGGAVPEEALARIGLGHVRRALLFPDQTRLMLATSAGLYVYEYPSMRRIWRRYLPQDASVDLSNDGRRIVTSVGLEGDALVFDAATGDRIASLEGTWSSARISPDSRWAVVEELPTDPFGQSIGRIHLYDLETGSHARSFEAPIRGFYGPIFSGFVWGSDSKTIASCVDNKVYIWDVETANIIYEGTGAHTQYPSGIPCGVVYSPDGSLVAIRSGERLVIVSLPGGQTILDEAIAVFSTTWIGSDLITADGQSISVFDGPTGTLIQRMDNAAIQVDASPGGKSLLARNNQSIAVYEPDLTLRYENPLKNEQVTWSPDGEWLTSYTLRLDPNSQGREQRELAQYTVTSALNGQVRCRAPETVGLRMLANGQMVVLSSGLFFVMEPCSSQVNVSARMTIPVNSLLWSDDERELRIGGPDGTWYWNETSSLVAQTSSAAFNSMPVEVNPDKPSYSGGKLTSPDGSTTISVLFDTACGDGPFGGGCGTWGSTIQIFKTGEVEPLYVLEDTHTGVTSLVWSPDGKTLASGHGGQYSDLQGGRIDLIDVSTGTVIKTFEGHLSHVVALYFSPSGRRLVSVSMDGTLIIWNTAQ